MKIKIKRFFCVILSCAILLQSFALSYRKAKATELIIGGELAAEAAGAAGLTFGTGGVGLLLLLGGLGVTVAWENREEIKDTVVATGEKIQGDFENFCDKAGTTIQSAQAEYDDFMDKLSKGICDTSSKFYDLFKKFVGDLSKSADSGSVSNDDFYKKVSETCIFTGLRGAFVLGEWKTSDGYQKQYVNITSAYRSDRTLSNVRLQFNTFERYGEPCIGLQIFGTDTDGTYVKATSIMASFPIYTYANGKGGTFGSDLNDVSSWSQSSSDYFLTCKNEGDSIFTENPPAPAYSGYTFPQVHPNYGNTATWDISDTDPFGISRPHDGIGRDIPITKPIEDVPDKPILNPETGQYEWTNTWDKVIGDDIPISDLINVGVVEVPEEDTPGKLWVNGKETDIPIEDSLPRPRETVEPTEEPKPTEEPDEETKKLRDKTVRPELKRLFPFCIPFDLYAIVSKFDAEPKAPEFKWKFIVGFNGTKPRYQNVRFKFSDFDSVAKVLRNMEKILFIVGIMMITRDKILKS